MSSTSLDTMEGVMRLIYEMASTVAAEKNDRFAQYVRDISCEALKGEVISDDVTLFDVTSETSRLTVVDTIIENHDVEGLLAIAAKCCQQRGDDPHTVGNVPEAAQSWKRMALALEQLANQYDEPHWSENGWPICPTCGTTHTDGRDRAKCEVMWRAGRGGEHTRKEA